MKRFFILLLISNLYAGQIKITGVIEKELPTHKRDNTHFLSTSSIANAFDGVHFFVEDKAKEVLKIWGHEFVFTYANKYAVLDGVSYRIKYPCRYEKDNFLIGIEDFKFLLSQATEFDINLDGNILSINTKNNERGSIVIVIDPGHGGKDPGAIGKNGTYEKNIVLDISRRISSIIGDEDVDVILTRDSDVFIPLADRTQIANEKGANVFISIHCNASKNRQITGIETFFLSPAKNHYARTTASLENAALLLEENPPVKDLDDVEIIIADMLHSEYIKESYRLSQLIQDKLISNIKRKDRGVNQAGFYVLAGAFMPSVLIEIGFISNPDEEKMLNQAYFRQRVSQSISDGIIAFLKEQGVVKK